MRKFIIIAAVLTILVISVVCLGCGRESAAGIHKHGNDTLALFSDGSAVLKIESVLWKYPPGIALPKHPTYQEIVRMREWEVQNQSNPAAKTSTFNSYAARYTIKDGVAQLDFGKMAVSVPTIYWSFKQVKKDLASGTGEDQDFELWKLQ